MEVMIQKGADGIICVSYPAVMDEKTITEYLKNLETELKNSPAKVKILTDTTGCPNIKMELLKKIAEGIAPLKEYIEKSAIIIILGNFQKVAANLTFYLSKRQDIKVFDNREEALAWLNEK